MVSRSLEQMAHHSAAAGFCPNGLYVQPALLANIKEGLDHFYFTADARPIEEALIFAGRKVDQDAVVGVYGADEIIRQLIAPKAIDGFIICCKRTVCSILYGTIASIGRNRP